MFLLELVYAGLFQIQNVPEEVLQPILLIEGPHLLFPFARRIVADVVRDGGMPPLMIEPIDFAALYRAKTGADAGTARSPCRLKPSDVRIPERVLPSSLATKFGMRGLLLPA